MFHVSAQLVLANILLTKASQVTASVKRWALQRVWIQEVKSQERNVLIGQSSGDLPELTSSDYLL